MLPNFDIITMDDVNVKIGQGKLEGCEGLHNRTMRRMVSTKPNDENNQNGLANSNIKGSQDLPNFDFLPSLKIQDPNPVVITRRHDDFSSNMETGRLNNNGREDGVARMDKDTDTPFRKQTAFENIRKEIKRLKEGQKTIDIGTPHKEDICTLNQTNNNNNNPETQKMNGPRSQNKALNGFESTIKNGESSSGIVIDKPAISLLGGRDSKPVKGDTIFNEVPEQQYKSNLFRCGSESCDRYIKTIEDRTKELEEENLRLKILILNMKSGLSNFQEELEGRKNEFESKMIDLKNLKQNELMENKTIEKNLSNQGSKVFITDDLWKVVITIMSGIEMSVRSYDFDVKQYAPSNKDYMMKNIFEVHHASLQTTKIAQFIDYSPPIFHYIRKVSRVSSESYIESLGPDCLSKVITGNMETFEGLASAGKSGSFFFTSSDKKYLVKTIKSDEFDKLKSILPKYFNYLSKNPASLICRILGLHKIVMTSMEGVTEQWTIIVMQNVLCTSLGLGLKYDLKGSTHKRITK